MMEQDGMRRMKEQQAPGVHPRALLRVPGQGEVCGAEHGNAVRNSPKGPVMGQLASVTAFAHCSTLDLSLSFLSSGPL